MVTKFLIYPVDGDKKQLIEDIKTVPSCHPQLVFNEEPLLVSIFCQNEIQQEFIIKQLARLDSVMWILPYTCPEVLGEEKGISPSSAIA